ncbi:MAG TPA: hypothetical protein VGG28_04630 [Kofleriaceae bacterium]|jgi:hypothetical protein
MDVVIDTNGFELDRHSRAALIDRARRAVEALGVIQFELVIKSKYLYSRDEDGAVFGYRASARAVLDDANAALEVVEHENFANAVDKAIDDVAAVVRRRRELEAIATACIRCGGTSFAFAPAWNERPDLDALVCKSCGRVEQHVRDPSALRHTLDVQAPTKAPYR